MKANRILFNGFPGFSSTGSFYSRIITHVAWPVLVVMLVAGGLQAAPRVPRGEVPPPPPGQVPDMAGLQEIIAMETACYELAREGRFEEALRFFVDGTHPGKYRGRKRTETEAMRLLAHFALKWRSGDAPELGYNLGVFMRDRLIASLEGGKVASLEGGKVASLEGNKGSSEGDKRIGLNPWRKERLELLMGLYADVLGDPVRAQSLAGFLELNETHPTQRRLRLQYGPRLKKMAASLSTKGDVQLNRIGITKDLRAEAEN